jgi:hypothetical protein
MRSLGCRQNGRGRSLAMGTRARASRLMEAAEKEHPMIRKLRTGEYRLYSRKVDPKTGKRRNLGTFKSRAAAEKHEREVQIFQAALDAPEQTPWRRENAFHCGAASTKSGGKSVHALLSPNDPPR